MIGAHAMPNDTRDVLRDLLRRTPDDIEAWLVSEMDAGTLPEGFNWRGLAEVAANNALPLEPAGPNQTLPWARVARLAYGRLGDSNERERTKREHDLMRLRAELILRLGPRQGDEFLDCETIFDWFLATHANSFDVVQQDAACWRDLPIERIRELRAVKHGISILRRLQACDRYAAPEVQRWLQLWDRLP
jgi:hypothetical protein